MSGFRSDSHTSACAAFPVTLVLKFCMVFKGISNVLLWSCPYEVWKLILNELALQQVCCFCNGVLMPLCAKGLGSWAMWLTSVKLSTSSFEIPIRNHHCWLVWFHFPCCSLFSIKFACFLILSLNINHCRTLSAAMKLWIAMTHYDEKFASERSELWVKSVSK